MTSNNPPAFPVLIVDRPKELEHFNGMTLRDYFAAKAMAVVMPSVMAKLQKLSYLDDKAIQLKNDAVGACYGMADAMLEARK